MKNISVIGLDLAKNIFYAYDADAQVKKVFPCIFVIYFIFKLPYQVRYKSS